MPEYIRPDFSCRMCGKECDLAPEPPDRAVCEKCCEDHDYIYIDREIGHACRYCGSPCPPDYFDR